MPSQVLVGVCRFSFLGRSDNVAWRGPADPGPDERARIAATLFARPRLMRRLHSFKRLCLASVRAQSDKGFIFLVLTSPELPGWARQTLEALCRDCANVEIVVSHAGSVDEALSEPLEAIGALGDQIVLFRLDDDDALHVNYVATLRRHAARMQGLPSFAVSFAKNVAISLYPGRPTRFWQIQRPFLAAGLAVKLPPGRGLFSYGHFAMRQRITNLTDLEQIGALVLKWPADSRAEVVGQKRFGYQPIQAEEFDRHLQRGFPFLRGFDFEILRRPPDRAASPPEGQGGGAQPAPAAAIPQGEA